MAIILLYGIVVYAVWQPTLYLKVILWNCNVLQCTLHTSIKSFNASPPPSPILQCPRISNWSSPTISTFWKCFLSAITFFRFDLFDFGWWGLTLNLRPKILQAAAVSVNPADFYLHSFRASAPPQSTITNAFHIHPLAQCLYIWTTLAKAEGEVERGNIWKRKRAKCW